MSPSPTGTQANERVCAGLKDHPEFDVVLRTHEAEIDDLTSRHAREIRALRGELAETDKKLQAARLAGPLGSIGRGKLISEDIRSSPGIPGESERAPSERPALNASATAAAIAAGVAHAKTTAAAGATFRLSQASQIQVIMQAGRDRDHGVSDADQLEEDIKRTLPGYDSPARVRDQLAKIVAPGIIARGPDEPVGKEEYERVLRKVRDISRSLLDESPGSVIQHHMDLAVDYLEWSYPFLKNCEGRWQARTLIAKRLKAVVDAKSRDSRAGKPRVKVKGEPEGPLAPAADIRPALEGAGPVATAEASAIPPQNREGGSADRVDSIAPAERVSSPLSEESGLDDPTAAGPSTRKRPSLADLDSSVVDLNDLQTESQTMTRSVRESAGRGKGKGIAAGERGAPRRRLNGEQTEKHDLIIAERLSLLLNQNWPKRKLVNRIRTKNPSYKSGDLNDARTFLAAQIEIEL